jgi:hypothetical protein
MQQLQLQLLMQPDCSPLAAFAIIYFNWNSRDYSSLAAVAELSVLNYSSYCYSQYSELANSSTAAAVAGSVLHFRSFHSYLLIQFKLGADYEERSWWQGHL